MSREIITRDERTIGELFSELANETGTLIRQEMALAQAEMTTKVTRAGKNLAYVAAGGFVGFAALLVLLAAVVAAMAYFMPVWLAALIVAVIVGTISYSMISSSLAALRRTSLAPNETVATLKEDAQWLRKQMT